MSDDLVRRLREDQPVTQDMASTVQCALQDAAADRIEELEQEVKTLRNGIEIYERERNRYKHAKPEITGAYFLAGGHGEIDDNYLPQFVEIVPAYGCGWSQVYEKTDIGVMYEGS